MYVQNQLIEYMIQDIVDMLATDQNIEYDEAMNKPKLFTEQYLN